MGANDYLTKPFRIAELRVRVNAHLRCEHRERHTALIFAGTSTGFITYANYSESSAKKLVSVIAATPDLTDVQLPMGCKYLVLDKNYQVAETSLEGDDLDQLWIMLYLER